MRFYKNQHQFYIGIDLHARMMYVCVINNIGETVFHKNMECSRDNLELVTNTFGKDSEVYRNTISDKFRDPATLKMVNADLDMFQAYHDIITKLEFQIEDSMEVQDPVSYSMNSFTIPFGKHFSKFFLNNLEQHLQPL